MLASGPACLSVSDAGRADVWCFTVPDTGNFELANGMIAAQCADDWRYGCMSRPYVPTTAKPAKPTELTYEVKADGRVVGNMGVRDMIDMLKRKKQRV